MDRVTPLLEEVTEAGIATLVDRFDAKVRRDPLIGPLFNAAIDGRDEHLATLRAFRSSVMQTSGLWAETAHDIFAPAVAEQSCPKANRIAKSLKLALFLRPGAAPAPLHT